MICHKNYTTSDTIDEFIDVTPGFFFCTHHYNEYQTTKNLPTEILNKIKEKRIHNVVKQCFEVPVTCPNSFLLNKPYELFLPTAVFQFSLKLSNFGQILELIKDDAIIIGIDPDSLFLKLAFIDYFSDQIGEKANESFQKVKNTFDSTYGKSIVGNLVNEPELTIPNEQQINELLNKPSMNILQNNEELSKVELDELVNLVLKHATSEDHKQYVAFLQNYKKDFVQAEKIVRKDITNNQYELVIVAQSVIANKFLNEYQQIKNSIKPSDIKERFLYRGARLVKHFGVIENGFEDNKKGANGALFGVGVYATENLFYACRYGNGNEPMNIYKRSPVFLCKTIYNKSKVVEINVKDREIYMSKPCSDDVKNNYGIHHISCGRSTDWRVVEPESSETNVKGEEFVFPNSSQIIPICSFIVMRSDHYVLWKDERIDTDYNQSCFKKVNEKIQVNLYTKKTVDEALKFIQLKIRNRVKLITNGGVTFSGRRLIDEARKIVGSNFICLVFSSHKYHCDWIVKTENVLYTSYFYMFEKFSLLKMDEKSILDFIDELEKLQKLKFKINKNQMLYFPNAEFNTQFSYF